MDIKILLASFGLVFLAELGDKTQLTAMALTASSKSGWMVFIGTSLALIATTALAVVFGAALTRWVPENVLHIVSAVAFILIGVVLLVNVARKAPMPAAAGEAKAVEASGSAVASASGGLIFEWVGTQAAAFEEEVVEYMESLIPHVSPPEQKRTLQEIVEQDRKHIAALRDMETLGDKLVAKDTEKSLAEKHLATVRSSLKKRPDRPAEVTSVRSMIEGAVQAEEHLADFYLALARQAKLHPAKDAFRWLAREDIDHAQRLCSLINPEESLTGTGPGPA
ncbi:MAG: TMEM165/GDT1 family protein [Lentisphaeria bacterium]